MLDTMFDILMCILFTTTFSVLWRIEYNKTSNDIIWYTTIYNNDNYTNYYKKLQKNVWISELCFMKNFTDNVENFTVKNKILFFISKNDITKNYCNLIDSWNLFEDKNWNSLLTWNNYDVFIFKQKSKTKKWESNIEKINNHYSFEKS